VIYETYIVDAYSQMFSGPYSHKILNVLRHNVRREALEASAEAVIEVDDGFK
jgi:hypothetical protein